MNINMKYLLVQNSDFKIQRVTGRYYWVTALYNRWKDRLTLYYRKKLFLNYNFNKIFNKSSKFILCFFFSFVDLHILIPGRNKNVIYIIS